MVVKLFATFAFVVRRFIIVLKFKEFTFLYTNAVESPISWKILRSNIKSHSERKIIEVLEIQKHSDSIMNGVLVEISAYSYVILIRYGMYVIFQIRL